MFRVLGFFCFLAVFCVLCGAECVTFAVERMIASALRNMSTESVTVQAKKISYVPWEMRASVKDVEAVWKDGSKLHVPSVEIYAEPLAFLACIPRLNAMAFSPYGSDMLASRIEAPEGFNAVMSDGRALTADFVSASSMSAGRGLMRMLDAEMNLVKFSDFQELAFGAVQMDNVKLFLPSGKIEAAVVLVRRSAGLSCGLLEVQDAAGQMEEWSAFPSFALRSVSVRGVYVSGGLWEALKGAPKPSSGAVPAQADAMPLAIERNGPPFGGVHAENASFEFRRGRVFAASADLGVGPEGTILKVRGLKCGEDALSHWGIRMPQTAGEADAALQGNLPLLLYEGGTIRSGVRISFPNAFLFEAAIDADGRTGALSKLEAQATDAGGLAAATAGISSLKPGGSPAVLFCGQPGPLAASIVRWAGTGRPLRLEMPPMAKGKVPLSYVPGHAAELLAVKFETKDMELPAAVKPSGDFLRDHGGTGALGMRPEDVKPDEDGGGEDGDVEILGEKEPWNGDGAEDGEDGAGGEAGGGGEDGGRI